MPEKLKLEHPVLIALLLALAVVAVYWPVTCYDFVNLDDPAYVTTNPHVQRGLTWDSIGWALTTLGIGMWHPLTWVSHMLDCQWFGLRPGWHHLTSLLFHATNTVLLLVVLRRMTGALWRSSVVAALFALHPLHVESVAWVAERKDVLSTFFLLLMLWAYARYAEGRKANAETASPKAEGAAATAVPRSTFDVRRSMFDARPRVERALSLLPSSIFYLLALVFFALGLMSKPMLVTAPIVLLLLDYWPLGRLGLSLANVPLSTIGRLLMEKLPFFVLAALTSLITLYGGNRVGSLPSAAEFPIPDRLANATLSYGRYFLRTFWPGNLAAYYPFPMAFSVWDVGGAALLLVGISVAAFCLARRWPYVVVGWLWYLVTLLPVIGLIQLAAYSHADRYTYVPLIGVFLLLTWGAGELLSHCGRPARVCAAAVVGAVILVCLLRTRQQISYWRDSERLFRHAASVTAKNLVAYNSLGFYYTARGRLEEAEKSFQAALGIQPNKYSWHGLGGALIDQRRYAEAVGACEAALKADPQMAKAHSTLGVALMKLGQTNDAMMHYAEALGLEPELAEAHYNLANALASQGQIETARQHYEASLRSDPSSTDAHNNLAYLLMREGKLDRAESEFKSALALQPDLWQAHYGLAAVLVRQGSDQGAIQHYHATLAVRPDFVEALVRLAWLLAVHPDPRVRDGPEALKLAEHACRLTQYGQPGPLRTLAAAYAEAGRFAEAISSAQKAQGLAQAAGQAEFVRKNQQLLELLQAGQPYREAVNPKPGAKSE
jgi:protein O-mannosyl-transferase